MYDFLKDAFKISQLVLLCLPLPKDVKYSIRALQNEINALETFPNDCKTEINIIILHLYHEF